MSSDVNRWINWINRRDCKACRNWGLLQGLQSRWWFRWLMCHLSPRGHGQITASFWNHGLHAFSERRRISVIAALLQRCVSNSVSTEGKMTPPLLPPSPHNLPCGRIDGPRPPRNIQRWAAAAVRMLRRHFARLPVAWWLSATDEHLSVMPDALWLKTRKCI